SPGDQSYRASTSDWEHLNTKLLIDSRCPGRESSIRTGSEYGPSNASRPTKDISAGRIAGSRGQAHPFAYRTYNMPLVHRSSIAAATVQRFVLARCAERPPRTQRR